jgi:putative restriction endonuclease
MPRADVWTHQQQLVALRLYCRLPFGRLHQHNPEIIDLAGRLGRTPSAVGMKACNFASLDPQQQARGISALGNVSNADRELWARFEADPEAVAAEMEQAWAAVKGEPEAGGGEATPDEADLISPSAETEREQVVRVRRVQQFFRSAVLVSYENRCALSDIAVPELLTASHIIPWAKDVKRRADPRNGLCLNALYDRAFDRGLISFDDELRVVVSPVLRSEEAPRLQREALVALEGRELRAPVRFMPDREALAWHRATMFREGAA